MNPSYSKEESKNRKGITNEGSRFSFRKNFYFLKVLSEYKKFFRLNL